MAKENIQPDIVIHSGLVDAINRGTPELELISAQDKKWMNRPHEQFLSMVGQEPELPEDQSRAIDFSTIADVVAKEEELLVNYDKKKFSSETEFRGWCRKYVSDLRTLKANSPVVKALNTYRLKKNDLASLSGDEKTEMFKFMAYFHIGFKDIQNEVLSAGSKDSKPGNGGLDMAELASMLNPESQVSPEVYRKNVRRIFQGVFIENQNSIDDPANNQLIIAELKRQGLRASPSLIEQQAAALNFLANYLHPTHKQIEGVEAYVNANPTLGYLKAIERLSDAKNVLKTFSDACYKAQTLVELGEAFPSNRLTFGQELEAGLRLLKYPFFIEVRPRISEGENSSKNLFCTLGVDDVLRYMVGERGTKLVPNGEEKVKLEHPLELEKFQPDGTVSKKKTTLSQLTATEKQEWMEGKILISIDGAKDLSSRVPVAYEKMQLNFREFVNGFGGGVLSQIMKDKLVDLGYSESEIIGFSQIGGDTNIIKNFSDDLLDVLHNNFKEGVFGPYVENSMGFDLKIRTILANTNPELLVEWDNVSIDSRKEIKDIITGRGKIDINGEKAKELLTKVAKDVSPQTKIFEAKTLDVIQNAFSNGDFDKYWDKEDPSQMVDKLVSILKESGQYSDWEVAPDELKQELVRILSGVPVDINGFEAKRQLGKKVIGSFALDSLFVFQLSMQLLSVFDALPQYSAGKIGSVDNLPVAWRKLSEIYPFANKIGFPFLQFWATEVGYDIFTDKYMYSNLLLSAFGGAKFDYDKNLVGSPIEVNPIIIEGVADPKEREQLNAEMLTFVDGLLRGRGYREFARNGLYAEKIEKIRNTQDDRERDLLALEWSLEDIMGVNSDLYSSDRFPNPKDKVLAILNGLIRNNGKLAETDIFEKVGMSSDTLSLFKHANFGPFLRSLGFTNIDPENCKGLIGLYTAVDYISEMSTQKFGEINLSKSYKVEVGKAAAAVEALMDSLVKPEKFITGGAVPIDQALWRSFVLLYGGTINEEDMATFSRVAPILLDACKANSALPLGPKAGRVNADLISKLLVFLNGAPSPVFKVDKPVTTEIKLRELDKDTGKMVETTVSLSNADVPGSSRKTVTFSLTDEATRDKNLAIVESLYLSPLKMVPVINPVTHQKVEVYPVYGDACKPALEPEFNDDGTVKRREISPGLRLYRKILRLEPALVVAFGSYLVESGAVNPADFLLAVEYANQEFRLSGKEEIKLDSGWYELVKQETTKILAKKFLDEKREVGGDDTKPPVSELPAAVNVVTGVATSLGNIFGLRSRK